MLKIYFNPEQKINSEKPRWDLGIAEKLEIKHGKLKNRYSFS